MKFDLRHRGICIVPVVVLVTTCILGCSRSSTETTSGSSATLSTESDVPASSDKEIERTDETSTTTTSTPDLQTNSPSDSAVKVAEPDCTESDSDKVVDGSADDKEYASPEDTQKLLEEILDQLDSYDESLSN